MDGRNSPPARRARQQLPCAACGGDKTPSHSCIVVKVTPPVAGVFSLCKRCGGDYSYRPMPVLAAIARRAGRERAALEEVVA